MRRGKLLLISILGLCLINLVSAYSLGDLLGDIESSTMILGAIFIVSFALLNFALSRFFKDKYGEPNRVTAGIVAFVISLLITWGINKTGFDIEGLFYDIGISSDLLYTALPILIIGGIIVLIWKFAKESLFILGGLSILASFFVYEKIIFIVVGTILIVARFFIPKDKWNMKKKGRRRHRYPRY